MLFSSYTIRAMNCFEDCGSGEVKGSMRSANRLPSTGKVTLTEPTPCSHRLQASVGPNPPPHTSGCRSQPPSPHGLASESQNVSFRGPDTGADPRGGGAMGRSLPPWADLNHWKEIPLVAAAGSPCRGPVAPRFGLWAPKKAVLGVYKNLA